MSSGNPTRVTLLGGYKRMRDGVYGKRNSILYANFAHQFRNVRFYGALLNPKSRANLLVGTTSHEHLENLFFAVSKRHSTGGENPAGRRRHALDEERQYAPGSPDRALVDDSNGLHKFRWCGRFIDVALSAGSDRF